MAKRKHGVWASSTRVCACGEPMLYSTYDNDLLVRGYDSYFCVPCDEWSEPGCSGPSCGYCADRPARPSHVPFELVELDTSPPKRRPEAEPELEPEVAREPRTEEEEKGWKELMALLTRFTN